MCTRAKGTRRVNSQSGGGPRSKPRQGRKVMFSDCECIQYVSGRRRRERARDGRAGREEIQMTGKEEEVETERKQCLSNSVYQNCNSKSGKFTFKYVNKL